MEKEAYFKSKPMPRPKLTKEEQAERKSDCEYYRQERLYVKEQKGQEKLKKTYVKREILVLKFMAKNDVKFYHHGQVDSMLDLIKENLIALKAVNANWCVYDPYIWNYQGEGNNYTSRCLLGNLWRGSAEFPTIYDVPLDGSYKFAITDSGNRGCGSYNYIKTVKADEEVYVAPVFPGGFFGF